VIPFVTNLFIYDPDKEEKDPDGEVVKTLQYHTLKYRFRIAKFPPALIGKPFNKAVSITYLSQQHAIKNLNQKQN
jgi:hypothetical protein